MRRVVEMMRMIEVKGRRVEGGGRGSGSWERKREERERLTTVSNVRGLVIRA